MQARMRVGMKTSVPMRGAASIRPKEMPRDQASAERTFFLEA
ncbi:hypothetical protein KR52_06900 [Synechococcus sp. KORDI-52]|nr:hypothetical protein KR52_06900 [Synechococcus sp. KORDI-52]